MILICTLNPLFDDSRIRSQQFDNGKCIAGNFKYMWSTNVTLGVDKMDLHHFLLWFLYIYEDQNAFTHL